MSQQRSYYHDVQLAYYHIVKAVFNLFQNPTAMASPDQAGNDLRGMPHSGLAAFAAGKTNADFIINLPQKGTQNVTSPRSPTIRQEARAKGKMTHLLPLIGQ